MRRQRGEPCIGAEQADQAPHAQQGSNEVQLRAVAGNLSLTDGTAGWDVQGTGCVLASAGNHIKK